MSKDILAGYPTQIRKLRKRLKQFNMEDADPKDVNETIKSLKDLQELYQDEVTHREDRRKAREEKAKLEKESIEEPLPVEPEVPADEALPEEPVEEPLTDKPKSSESVPSSYFIKHLVEGLTAGDNPAMQALGYDCLKEVIEALDDEARHNVYEKWENYFNNDPEFKEVLAGNISPRLQEQHDEMQQYIAKKEETLPPEVPIDDIPVDEPLPEEDVMEVESTVAKYALDDNVEPTRGSLGSRGRVMRYDEDSDLAYIHWDEGKLAERDGFGTYKGSDLRNLTRQAESPPGWETTVEDMKQDKGIDNPFALAWWMKNKGYEPEKKSFLSRQAEMKSELTHSDECEQCGTKKRYPGQCRTCKKNKEVGDYRKDASDKKADDYLPGERKQRDDREHRFQEKRKTMRPQERTKSPMDLAKDDADDAYAVRRMKEDYGDDIDKEGAGNQAVVDSWLNRRNSNTKSSNLYILPKEDGWELVNYRTVIAKHLGDKIAYSNQRYSSSTGRIQAYIRQAADAAGIPLVDMNTGEPIDEGVKREDADFHKMDVAPDYERLSALDVEAAGEGIGYGGNRPGIAVAPKRDDQVSLNADDEIDEDEYIGSPSWMHKVIEEMQLYYQRVKIVPDFDDQVNYVMDIANDEAGQLTTTPEQVEKWFKEYHYESEKTADSVGDVELNVANMTWVAKKSQTAEGGLGWAIFSTQPVNFQGKEVPAGTQIMVIKDNTERGLSQPELEQAFFDNFGKDLARISLKVDLAILKKGSEVKPLAYDARRRELKFIAVGNNKISGWTSVDKFDFIMKEASEVYCKNTDCQRKGIIRRPDGYWCEKHAPEYKPEDKKESSWKKAVHTSKCVKCDKSCPVEDMVDNVHGAGYLCKDHAKEWNKDTEASVDLLQKELEGSKVEDKVIRIKSVKILEELAEKCPDCFEKFVKFAEKSGKVIKADDVEDIITNIREKIKTTKERLETIVEPIETESKKEVKAQDPNSPPTDDPGAGYKWFWNEKTMAWEKMQEGGTGGTMTPGGGFAGGVTY